MCVKLLPVGSYVLFQEALSGSGKPNFTPEPIMLLKLPILYAFQQCTIISHIMLQLCPIM